MSVFKKIGRVMQGKNPETGERLKGIEGWKQLHNPSRSIFNERQERLTREAEQQARDQEANINRTLSDYEAALRRASNPPTPLNYPSGLIEPPSNEGIVYKKPEEKTDLATIGLAVAAAIFVK